MDADVPPVTAPQFAITERGYDRQQVEEFVTQLQQRLDEARERLTIAEADHARAFDGLHRRIAELEDGQVAGERGVWVSTDRDFRALGNRIGRMLELADAEAAAMRERAARDAEETIARARREAEQLTQEEQEKRDGLQRQLHALHESLASLLGILPADVAAAAGVTPATETPPSETPATETPAPDVIDLSEPAPASAVDVTDDARADDAGTPPTDPYPSRPTNDVSLDDLLDDSTQVVQIIRGGDDA